MLMNISRLIEKNALALGKPVYCLIYGKDRDLPAWMYPLRLLCSFIVGILLTYLLWVIVTVNFDLSFIYGNEVPQETAFAVCLILNGISFMISRNVRSITVVAFVSQLGHTGRIYLRAIAFSIIVTGPVENLALNTAEMARVFACSTVLTYNLSKTRYDLMAKPFTNTLQNMKGDIDEIQTHFKDLKNIMGDLHYGVEHTDIEDDAFGEMNPKYRRAANNVATTSVPPEPPPKAKEIQKRFIRNMRNLCKHQLRSGHQICEEIFRQGDRKCSTNFPPWLGKVICWPFRVDVICKVDMFGSPDKVCDATKAVPADFGATYVAILKAEHDIFANSSEIEITYKPKNTSTTDQLRSAQVTMEKLMVDIEERRKAVIRVMHIIDKILCLFIIIVLFSSVRYHWLYRGDIQFDNLYITDYFKHVDARRKLAGKRSILPLKNYERHKYVDVDELGKDTDSEWGMNFHYMLKLAIEIVVAVLFVFLDRMVVILMHVIRDRSLITYQPEGEHEVRFRINGTGVMARLLRNTMNNFNIHTRISTSLSNEDCLPNPKSLPIRFYFKLLFIHMIIVLLTWYSVFFIRMRSRFCGYFYYHREKQRTLYLYTKLQRARRTPLLVLRDNAEHNMATRHVQGRTNIFLFLRLSYPQHFGWLAKFDCSKRSCLTCCAVEDINFIICPRCQMPFCRDCLRELRHVCIFCELYLLQDGENPLTAGLESENNQKDE